MTCDHLDTEPVTISNGEQVASICLSCDAQLSPRPVNLLLRLERETYAAIDAEPGGVNTPRLHFVMHPKFVDEMWRDSLHQWRRPQIVSNVEGWGFMLWGLPIKADETLPHGEFRLVATP